jgi:hypothetical protein
MLDRCAHQIRDVSGRPKENFEAFYTNKEMLGTGLQGLIPISPGRGVQLSGVGVPG